MNVFLPMFFLGLICLIYLGYQDLKTREINITPLLIFSVIGIIYFIFFGIFKGFIWLYILQLIISSIFLLTIYILGRFTTYAYIGEGDLIAIFMISAISGVSVLFAPFVFLMGLLLTLILPIAFFIYNIIKGNYPKRKISDRLLLMFFGFPKDINSITNFYMPLEKYSIKSKKIISVVTIKPNTSTEKQINELKIFAKEHKIKKVWVSPLMPFIITLIISYSIIGALTYFNLLKELGYFAISFV